MEKGIRSYQRQIKRHTDKMKYPKKYYKDWDSKSKRFKKGCYEHWRKELRNFKKNMNDNLQELKRRDSDD